MPKKPPQRDPIGAYQRKATAGRRVGGNKRCSCGESRPEALVRASEPTMCTECVRRKKGKSTQDNHHPAGKANNPTTTPIPANDHRAELTPAQYDWPKRTLENPDGSPLLAAAACTRGYVDTSDYLREKLLLRNPEMLEVLDAFLVEKLGPKWWIGTDLERFSPKRRKSNAAPRP